MAMSHSDLCRAAVKWLKEEVGCATVLVEPRSPDGTGEEPDVLGVLYNGYSVLVECKTSLQDLIVDRRKPWRITPDIGIGQRRWILAEEGVITAIHLPPGWGLLVIRDGQCILIKGAQTWNRCNKMRECALLASAYRHAVHGDAPKDHPKGQRAKLPQHMHEDLRALLDKQPMAARHAAAELHKKTQHGSWTVQRLRNALIEDARAGLIHGVSALEGKPTELVRYE